MKKEPKTAEVYTSFIQYHQCPYCKKMVIMAEKETCKALKKWKKSKKKTN